MPTDREIIDAFAGISEVWGVARKGILVGLNGARAGTWSWNKRRMFVNPEEGSDFLKVMRRLQKDGVVVREPASKLSGSDDNLTGDASVQVTKELGRLTPGELDHALKLEGFFLIDSELPISNEA